MIISHSRSFIFIKSYKTASTSVEAILSNYCSEYDFVTPLSDFKHNRTGSGEWVHRALSVDMYQGLEQHADAATIRSCIQPQQWSSYFKVSLARNPWDRAVSFFYWENRRDPEMRPAKRFYHRLGVPFDEPKILREKFRQFLKSDRWSDNDRFYFEADRLCVDFVIRYENLNDDFAEVCRRLELPTPDLPRLKAGIREKHHYSRYYDDETRALVAERHKNDIKILGYRFETA